MNGNVTFESNSVSYHSHSNNIFKSRLLVILIDKDVQKLINMEMIHVTILFKHFS